MSERRNEETLTSIDGGGRPTTLDQRAYLVVFDSDTSRKVHLPDNGELTIGRADGVDVKLRSPLVSRRHAKITMVDGDARVVDLESHNGITVNGSPISGEARLRPRDNILLANVVLIFYAGLRTQTRRSPLELADLTQRATAMIKARRPFILVTLALMIDASDRESVEQALPRGDALAAWSGLLQLVVIVPDVSGRAEAEAKATRYLDTLRDVARAKAGFSSFPGDGATFEELLRHAESALLGARTGQVSSEATRIVELPGVRVLLGDPAMVRLYQLLEKLAASELPILVGGETGTGKELAAAAIHHWSPRRGKPLMALNCAALPENLAESELFGYEKGAFSGAQGSKLGLLEAAKGGSIFLDEVGELSLSNQAKLLRVLETRRLMRLGDVKEREIDIRIIAATNRDLEAEADAGRFRRDLYFRLSAATVWLPPLRDRPREILSLAKQFIDAARERAGQPRMALSPATTEVLLRYRWPGNIRELKNVMEYVAVAGSGLVVEPAMLPARVNPPLEPATAVDRTLDGALASFRPIDEELRELEKSRMVAALAACDGNQTRAAELIDMPRRTFVQKLKQYNLLKKGEETR